LRQALKRTSLRRPDLLEQRALSPLEVELLGEIHREADPD
jgi:tRNA G37 N-methylase TrmD